MIYHCVESDDTVTVDESGSQEIFVDKLKENIEGISAKRQVIVRLNLVASLSIASATYVLLLLCNVSATCVCCSLKERIDSLKNLITALSHKYLVDFLDDRYCR